MEVTQLLPIMYMALVDDDDLPSFETLYEKHKQKAYLTAFAILKNESLAEDCVSETFLSIAKNFHNVNKLNSYEQQKYIFISIRNRALNILTKEKEHLTDIAYDDEIYFHDEQYSSYDLSDWKESISRLNKTDKDILYLISILGMSYKDAATALGISYAATKQRFWTAKSNLRKLILGEDDRQ